MDNEQGEKSGIDAVKEMFDMVSLPPNDKKAGDGIDIPCKISLIVRETGKIINPRRRR
ncbi:MAG: hypothetical protein E3K37_03515 [Candidatus Kuenenia sp.]|nr:hypothetical protein [Candidatus Kuenenia hertensis]